MNEPIAVPPSRRSPWQRFYEQVHEMRWRWHAPRAGRLPRPVISVGSLHWGGVGKTPIVTAMGRHLAERGLRTAILSRGYGRKDKGIHVVSTGDGPLLGPLVAGDEPVLLAGDLPGVAVVVARDRFDAGRHALERLSPSPDVFLLDDGFSHLKLFRDIDLVVFPSTDPLAGGKLPPGGRLREPLAAMRRADAGLMMGATPSRARDLGEVLRSSGFAGPTFSCDIDTLPARLTGGERLPPEARVLLVAGIAKPQRFVSTVRESGFAVADILTFPDHHAYPERSLRRIEESWHRTTADAVLTTSKDRVKLFGRLDLPLAELPVHARPEEQFWDWLRRRLDQQMTGSRT